MKVRIGVRLIGSTLGHYRILEKLGAGGMGEVYRAEDQTLKRQVALKILPPELAASPERLERFQREAESLAALDHPNIVTIHSVEKVDDIHFFTMQLVEGRSLAESIPAGGMSMQRFFDCALPLAEALAAAHDKGIIHRDLKPANVMVTSAGSVKVLDFGLAKPSAQAVVAETSAAPTEMLTRDGILLGTLPYMSPEHIQGKEADRRSDIFSLGIVLHEMAVGERPFGGKTAADLISSTLRDEPASVDELRPDLPRQLGRIVRHCLQRSPSDRFQTARDVYNELFSLRQELSGGGQRAASIVPAGLAGEPPPIRSLAVLPLENLSRDPEQEYFADGMTEALITDLSKIGALKVISRTSSMQYKGVHKPLREIARELQVDGVIEGSVLRADDRVRITAQLLDARSDVHLWAESYDRDLRDILGLMSEFARTVADEVRVKLTRRERSLLAREDSIDPQAHEAYLKGRFLLGRLTREGAEQAIEWMQKAIDIDPTYAQAHAGLAECHLLLMTLGYLRREDGDPLIRRAALEALARDNTLAEAHTALATIDARDWNWQTAEEGFQRALELSPNHALAHDGYSLLLVWLDRLEEAIAHGERAVGLEPLSLKPAVDLAFAHYYARDYGEAERRLREVLALHPKASYAEWALGVVLAEQGRYDESIGTFLAREVPNPGMNWGLGYIYGIAGRSDEARRICEFLVRKAEKEWVPLPFIAYVHLGLGDRQRAMELLEQTCDQREGRLVYIQVDPWLDALRDEPRFQALVRRMAFP